MSQDYSQYDGKKVVVTVNDSEAEGGQTTIEGTVSVGNDMGLLLKPKGKTGLDLIEAAKIVGVEAAPDTPKKLQVKALQPLKDSQARQHLVDRHGYSVADVESMSDEDALTFHSEDVDHAPLGHNHDGKPKVEKDAEAETEAAA